jgi:chemotaxis protein histidine kinase CheA
METSEYLPMFLAEGREHLQELNLAVVRIEERPDDQDTVDEIFRIAHSLKGMSATMGFAGMAALTHETCCSSASTRCRPRSTRSTRAARRISSRRR